MDSRSDAESQTPTMHEELENHIAEKVEKSDLEKGNFPEPSTQSTLSTVAPGPDPNTFPDGGFDAWFCIAGGFCTIFASLGWINCIGVFQDYYQSHQLSSYSPSTIAWIPATESFMLFFCGLASGTLTDKYGPRWPIFFGSFMHIFGLMMLSISKEYYQIFLAQSICSAIGTSFLFYPTIAAAGTWFKKHRALAFGIMVSGSSAGGLVLPIMVQHLIVEVGFGWSIRITAFLLLGLLVLGNIAVKSRLPPVQRKYSVKENILPFTELPFFLLAVASLIIYLGAFLPFNFIIVQATEAGMSTDLANYLVPIINAASIFGRILPAHLGDLYGVFNVCIIFTLFSGIINLALWLPAASNAAIIVFAALYGFASGLTLAIIPALVASISDVQKLGFRVGTLYAFSAFGVLLGSPIAGAIVTDQHGGFSGLKIFGGVTLITGGLFVMASRVRLVGPRLLVRK